MLTGLPLLRGDQPPLDPTADQAREWVRRELLEPQYLDRPGLWERLMRWLSERLQGSGDGPLNVPQVPALVIYLGVVLVLAAIGYAVWRSVRAETGERRRKDGAGAVLDTDRHTASEYRALAQRALEAGRYDEAVLAAYRAIAVAGIERTLLEDLPGRTAHEVAAELAPFFPEAGSDLPRASDAFDAVRYGHLPASADTARAVVDLDLRLARSRPQFAAREPVAAGSWDVS